MPCTQRFNYHQFRVDIVSSCSTEDIVNKTRELSFRTKRTVPKPKIPATCCDVNRSVSPKRTEDPSLPVHHPYAWHHHSLMS